MDWLVKILEILHLELIQIKKILQSKICYCFFLLLFYHRDNMQIFTRLTSLLLTFVVGFFSMSPSMTLGAWQDKIIVMGGRVGDTCTVNIECFNIGESRIVCQSSGEMIIPAPCTIHSIWSIVSPLSGLTPWSYGTQDETHNIPQKIGLLYREPDTFVYPFVSIIKIQV